MHPEFLVSLKSPSLFPVPGSSLSESGRPNLPTNLPCPPYPPSLFSSFPVTLGDYGDCCNSQQPEGRNGIFQNSGLLPSQLIPPPSLCPKPQFLPAACCHGYSNLYLLCLLNKLALPQPTSWLPPPLWLPFASIPFFFSWDANITAPFSHIHLPDFIATVSLTSLIEKHHSWEKPYMAGN